MFVQQNNLIFEQKAQELLDAVIRQFNTAILKLRYSY